MDRCELCQKELVPFSYRESYGKGVICGVCAEKQKAGKTAPAKASAPPAPARPEPAKAEAPKKAEAPPEKKPPAPGAKGEGGEDDFSSAIESLLN